jgi:uncharacterized protein YjbJ (UPF0337 family)
VQIEEHNAINAKLPGQEEPISKRRTPMESSIREKIEGSLQLMKGKASHIVRKLGDSAKLEADGAREKVAGNVQEKIGQIRKFFGK